MGRYKILLLGENFLLSIDGDHAKFGFYATRIIKSESAEQAERIAIIRIHQELNRNHQIVKNIPDVPTVRVEKSEKMGPFQFVSKRNASGFAFHSEKEKTAEQSSL
jgi:hypothetical protein